MYLCSLKFKENVRISQAIDWTIVRLQSLWLVYRKRPRKSTVQGLRLTELTALRSHIHTPKAPPQQVLEHTHTHTRTSRAQSLAAQPTGCSSAPGWAAPPAALHPGAVPAGHRQQPHCHVFCSRVLSVGGCAPGPPASCALRPPHRSISSSGCFIRSIKILLWSKVFGTRKTIPSSGGSTALMSRGGSSSEAVREKQQNIHLMEYLVVLSSCFKEA